MQSLTGWNWLHVSEILNPFQYPITKQQRTTVSPGGLGQQWTRGPSWDTLHQLTCSRCVATVKKRSKYDPTMVKVVLKGVVSYLSSKTHFLVAKHRLTGRPGDETGLFCVVSKVKSEVKQQGCVVVPNETRDSLCSTSLGWNLLHPGGVVGYKFTQQIILKRMKILEVAATHPEITLGWTKKVNRFMFTNTKNERILEINRPLKISSTTLR